MTIFEAKAPAAALEGRMAFLHRGEDSSCAPLLAEAWAGMQEDFTKPLRRGSGDYCISFIGTVANFSQAVRSLVRMDFRGLIFFFIGP